MGSSIAHAQDRHAGLHLIIYIVVLGFVITIREQLLIQTVRGSTLNFVNRYSPAAIPRTSRVPRHASDPPSINQTAPLTNAD